ncbi:MAG: hypothetical protein P8Z30_14165 [Acidobacteriota bacterium]
MEKSFVPAPFNPGLDVVIFSSNWDFIDHHREVLLSIGFGPIAATTPEATLAVLRLTAIELVIVDERVGVPETRRILKQTGNDSPKVPVLVVSSSFNAELRRQALELGAAGYLDHPALQDDVVLALLPDRALTGNSLWGSLQN